LIKTLGFFSSCLDMDNGKVGDMVQLGILESFHLKRQVVISAAEAAEMVLRIDNIIRAPPRPRQRDMRHH
jgi:T-complex protein 1 subunit beta